MPNKPVPKEKQKKIRELFNERFIAEIARELNISKASVRKYGKQTDSS